MRSTKARSGLEGAELYHKLPGDLEDRVDSEAPGESEYGAERDCGLVEWYEGVKAWYKEKAKFRAFRYAAFAVTQLTNVVKVSTWRAAQWRIHDCLLLVCLRCS